MIRSILKRLGAYMLIPVLFPTAAAAAEAETPSNAELLQRIAQLEGRLQHLEDVNAVKDLQRIYGYYVDKTQWDQVTDLFADDATLEIAGRGVFVGKQRIRQYMHDLPDLEYGRLFNHIVLQPVVHVAEDGMTAKARARVMVQFGILGRDAQWGDLIYENEYVKQDGIWKIKKLHAYVTYYIDYAKGWVNGAHPKFEVKESLPPDLPPTVQYDAYPGVYIPPYHYANPVSGRR